MTTELLETLKTKTLKIKDVPVNSLVMAAPMAGISDLVYRTILRDFSKEALLTTEMISSEALKYQKHPSRIIDRLDHDTPLMYQLSGHKPDVMLESAQKIQHLADLIDVNMGCPIPKIVKNGDGSALMRTPELAAQIVKTMAENLEKPVTVKFRLGWDNNSINCVDFAKRMEDSGASLITVHGRTRSQLYAGKAKWKVIAKVKEAVSIPVLANGDVISPETALECLQTTGCDGVAIGRGLLGDPWLLHRVDHYFKTGEILPPPTVVERVDMAIRHTKALVEDMGEYLGVRNSRKFFGWYIKYVHKAPKYRDMLNRTESLPDLLAVLEEIKQIALEPASVGE